MKPKEFYKDTYGEDPPKTFDKMAAILLFDFAEASHASQTEMVSEKCSSIKPISDMEYCVQCFIRSEYLTRKWDKFRDEWFAEKESQLKGGE